MGSRHKAYRALAKALSQIPQSPIGDETIVDSLKGLQVVALTTANMKAVVDLIAMGISDANDESIVAFSSSVAAYGAVWFGGRRIGVVYTVPVGSALLPVGSHPSEDYFRSYEVYRNLRVCYGTDRAWSMLSAETSRERLEYCKIYYETVDKYRLFPEIAHSVVPVLISDCGKDYSRKTAR